MNRYDLNHVTHRASADVARGMGARLPAGLATLLHARAHRDDAAARAATRANASNALFLITWFKGCIDIENIHPLEGGFLRLKCRRDRRPGMPLEPVWPFYPKYWLETAGRSWCAGASLYLRLRRIYLRIKHDPNTLRLHRPRADAGHRRRDRDASSCSRRDAAQGLRRARAAPGATQRSRRVRDAPIVR